MVNSDFKRFYESFTQAKLSLLYSLELHKDSMFALKKGTEETSSRQTRSLELSHILFRKFQSQVTEMESILEEYHHLLVFDNFDCSSHISGKEFLFKCWYKRYGFSLLCLGLFVFYAWCKVFYAVQKRARVD